MPNLEEVVFQAPVPEEALEAFQLVGAIFGLLQVTLMSSLVKPQIHPRATW